MASPPFNIDQTAPGDPDIASTFPALERSFRDIVESWLLIEHNNMGKHTQVGFTDRVSSVPDGEAGILTVWQDSGVLKARMGTDVIKNVVLTDGAAGLPNSNLASMVADTIKGRAHGAGAGVPQDLTGTQATVILDVLVGDTGSGGTKGLVPAPATGDGAAGKVLGAGGTWINTGYPAVVLWDQKAQNTAAGTSVGDGVWHDRVLNTKYYDLGSLATLASNIFTLHAGVYVIEWSTPMFSSGVYQSRLFNSTDATLVQVGTTELADNGTQQQTRSFGIAKVTITGDKGFKIQYQCRSSKGTNGQGFPANISTELYTVVKVWKLG